MVIETLTFRLAAGTGRDDFVAADKAWQNELIPNRGGYLRRTTACSDDGLWLVTTLWATPADAEAFRATAEASDQVRRFFSLIDGSSVDRRIFTTLD